MSEEVPIELYRKTNNEFVKYVRYEDYKKLENIIKEVREYIKAEKVIKEGNALEQITNYERKLLEILDKVEE